MSDWADDAACRKLNMTVRQRADLFSSDYSDEDVESDPEQVERAVAICLGCPARLACLTEGLAEEKQFNIRAGFTARQRTQIKRRVRRGETTPQQEIEDSDRRRLADASKARRRTAEQRRRHLEQCRAYNARTRGAARRRRREGATP